MSSKQMKSDEPTEQVEYFPNPQIIIEMYPERAHLIKQSYLTCELCKNSIAINNNNIEALSERYNRHKQNYNGYCLTVNCMKNQRKSVDQLKEHAKFKRIDNEVYQMETHFEEIEKIRDKERLNEQKRHERWVRARNEQLKLFNAFKLSKEKAKDETK